MAVFSELYDYILTMIEKDLKPGDKLPGARQIADLFSCSLPRVQAVLDSLEQSGVIRSRARSGTFVCDGYKEQLLPQNVVCSKFLRALPMEQKAKFRQEFPDLHLTDTFQSGGVEILSTFSILSRQQHYEDLSALVSECFPDCNERFYMDVIKPFIINGKLCALPVMFSPQLLWYNPEIFRKTGTSIPTDSWEEKEFLDAIRNLHRSMSGRRIINFSPEFQHWIRFVLAAGGELFDENLTDPVLADSPQTIEACIKYSRLLHELDLVEDYQENPIEAFAQGKLAMFSGFRQSSYFFWEYSMDFVPQAICMPNLGVDAKQLGAGLIAFRKGYYDPDQIKQLLRFWLSEPIQETFGKIGYGIPFLRSAAQNTLDPNSMPDRQLLDAMPSLASNYHIYSEELGKIISRSGTLISSREPEDISKILKALATTMRYIYQLERRH